MPSQFHELCFGKTADGKQTKTQVGKNFIAGYTYQKTIGWIWSSQDDNMIPLYSSYNSTTKDWRLQISETLDSGYKWTNPSDASSSSTTPIVIGYIYDVQMTQPKFTVDLDRGYLASNNDTLVTNGDQWDSQYGTKTGIGYIIPPDTSIVDFYFIDPANETPLVISPLITKAKPQPIQPKTKIKLDLWNRITAVVSWDNPTRVAPGLEYTERIPIVQEASSGGNISIPPQSTPGAGKGPSMPQVLTTVLKTKTSQNKVTFNTGEVNEIGNDADATVTPLDMVNDDTTQWTVVLVVNQASVTVRFQATIARGNKGASNYVTFKESGTFTTINTTSVTAYALKKATDSDISCVLPAQIGRNSVVQYAEIKGDKAENKKDISRDGSNSMPMGVQIKTGIPEDNQNNTLLTTSDLDASTYADEADPGYYNNIPTPIR